LYGANPPPASAENLQKDFSFRLNEALRRIVPPAAPSTVVDGFLVRVHDVVASRQDLQQIAAADLSSWQCPAVRTKVS